MESNRWWHVAVSGTAALLAALVVWGSSSTTELVGGLGALVVFVVGWFTIGRHGGSNPKAATAFVVITIVAAGVGTAFSPSFATIQTIAYPIIWVMSRRLTDAVLANIALATVVGVGSFISTGSLVQALGIQGISLVFSVALGLWISSISDRSEERQRLLDELRDAQDQLAAVSRDAGVASERERLAREIHDTIAQDLTALVMLTQRARRELVAGHPEQTDQQLALIEENARLALAETRGLVAASAPVSLTTGGIADALTRLAERFSRETGVTVGVEVGELAPLGRDTEVVLLRVAQEGLGNVRKHSGAESAVILLASEDGGVRLEVRDDGGGFDVAQSSDGFGLNGLRERLALVQGALDVTSSPDGTTLVATLPVGA